jgi:hypothetical protein
VLKPDDPSVATTFLTGGYLITNAAETITSCWPSIQFGEAAVTGMGGATIAGESAGGVLKVDFPPTLAAGVPHAGATLAWEPEGGCDQGIGIRWDALDLADLTVGDAWTFQAHGEVDGMSNTALGSMDLELIDKSSGKPTFQCLADYADVGSATQRIQVFEGGAMVSEYPSHSGAFTIRSSSPPDGCGKELVVIDGGNTACYRMKFVNPDTLVMDGIAGTSGPVTVVGDEIAVLAETPSVGLSRLESFSVFASAGFPDLHLNSATGVAPTRIDDAPAYRFSVGRPYPNPFNPELKIRFVNPRRTAVSVDVFDVAGRRVRRLLANEILASGPQTLTWNGRDDRHVPVASGVYLVRVKAGALEQTVKATLLK